MHGPLSPLSSLSDDSGSSGSAASMGFTHGFAWRGWKLAGGDQRGFHSDCAGPQPFSCGGQARSNLVMVARLGVVAGWRWMAWREKVDLVGGS
jgi:hypothetical protein